MPTVAERPSITGHDQYLFREGTHSRLYEKLGATNRATALMSAVRLGLVKKPAFTG